MRARLAIAYADVSVELREVELRNKPQAMLLISPKATVPVLQLENGRVLDESLDIMLWALQQNDPEHWLNAAGLDHAKALIQRNDEPFKYYLDRYKYADRYPAYSELYYRQQGELFLVDLEDLLTQHAFLCGEHLKIPSSLFFFIFLFRLCLLIFFLILLSFRLLFLLLPSQTGLDESDE